MASVPAPSPTVVDQTTLMKKYLQFVAALTDTNTRKLFLYVEMIFLIYTFVIYRISERDKYVKIFSKSMFFIHIHLHAIFQCIELFVFNKKISLKLYLCSAWAM